ncbi:unnamed protein product [Staurois parvus]|uniref:Uncharacterized protein n=1 Tax=Staurois parvus TaxID=386267 RepID=A0ABN9F804_9NEOB|nr:unnamed protein product [Staurois parvus]
MGTDRQHWRALIGGINALMISVDVPSEECRLTALLSSCTARSAVIGHS